MSKTLRLLIVEDSDDDARLAVRMLRRAGFAPTYRRVQRMDELREALREGGWDAVLSDFSLPGFTGVDALKAFSQAGLDVPFIFVSGTIGEETAVAAMKAGANDYVMKQNLARLPLVVAREIGQVVLRAQRRQAEADLRGYESQLRHAQKMESVGTLAGGIAHDFNNILGAILGNVMLARQMLGPGHVAGPCLEEIEKAGKRARGLVRQILTFSRRQPQELKVQKVRPIVEETLRLLRAVLPAQVELVARLAPEALHLRSDVTQIQQVLMNLCTNAWQALTDGRGRIEVGLAHTDLGLEAARHCGLAPGAYVQIWVRDNGSGMDAATRERIFEPFFTTKPIGQGTGLGLSVVHGIVSTHQGAVDVESAPGRGSVFRLYFPLADAAEQGAETAPVPLTLDRGHGERVLYVDDDAMIVLVVERILQVAGYQVDSFPDAAQALQALRAQPRAFDLVVTDYNMPDRSGLDIAREIRGFAPALPVIICSGYVTDELREQARVLGVAALVEKQNLYEDLPLRTAQVLERRPV